jgi:hypothetical protein
VKLRKYPENSSKCCIIAASLSAKRSPVVPANVRAEAAAAQLALGLIAARMLKPAETFQRRPDLAFNF